MRLGQSDISPRVSRYVCMYDAYTRRMYYHHAILDFLSVLPELPFTVLPIVRAAWMCSLVLKLIFLHLPRHTIRRGSVEFWFGIGRQIQDKLARPPSNFHFRRIKTRMSKGLGEVKKKKKNSFYIESRSHSVLLGCTCTWIPLRPRSLRKIVSPKKKPGKKGMGTIRFNPEP